MVVVPGREPAFRNQPFVHIGRSASVVLSSSNCANVYANGQWICEPKDDVH
jgi:hypothetical protein